MPCEACVCLQAGMKETGEAVVSLCQSLGLPCSLKDLLEQLKLGHLSACDVSQWASEQRRDMGRVGKHVLEVRFLVVCICIGKVMKIVCVVTNTFLKVQVFLSLSNSVKS